MGLLAVVFTRLGRAHDSNVLTRVSVLAVRFSLLSVSALVGGSINVRECDCRSAPCSQWARCRADAARASDRRVTIFVF